MGKMAIKEVLPEQLQSWMSGEKQVRVLHVLSQEHYEAVRIPGSLPACVFEVAFADHVETHVGQKSRAVVLVGAGGGSRDTKIAAWKMGRMGYTEVYVLDGGLAAWNEAGLPLEGTRGAEAIEEGPAFVLEPGRYNVDLENSGIHWTGRNANGGHWGHISLASGHFDVGEGGISGRFEVDMDSIQNADLEGDPYQPALIAHLKSDDFFFVEKYPAAIFNLVSAEVFQEGERTSPNANLKGVLELRGMKQPLSFSATVNPGMEGGIRAEAHFDLDRTLWGVIYGSSKFFSHMGMHMVYDLVSVEIRVAAG